MPQLVHVDFPTSAFLLAAHTLQSLELLNRSSDAHKPRCHSKAEIITHPMVPCTTVGDMIWRSNRMHKDWLRKHHVRTQYVEVRCSTDLREPRTFEP